MACSAGQNFAPTFMRHMHDYGTTSAQVAHVKVAHSKHASNNPKALLKQRVTVDDVLNSRWITKPLHLLDCCLETDNATCIIVTAADRAKDLKQRPIYHGGGRRVSKPRVDFHFVHGPISRVAGYYAKDIVFPMAGIGPRMSISPVPTMPSPSPPCCSSKNMASARKVRAVPTCPAASSSSGAAAE